MMSSNTDAPPPQPTPKPIKHTFAVIALGQFIACLNAGTAVFSNLLVEHTISFSFCQSFLNYFLLTIFFIPLFISRRNKIAQEQASNDHNRQLLPITADSASTHTPGVKSDSTEPSAASSSDQESYLMKPTPPSFMDIILPRYASIWVYIILSFFDVHANFAIVKAYQYTSMLAVQLIDSANLPFVLLLSAYFLGRKYTKIQLFACACCLVGLFLCIVTDIYSRSSNSSNSDSHSISMTMLGDGLVVFACLAYASSNILQEKVLSQPPANAAKASESETPPSEPPSIIHWDRTFEYLAYLGLCATFFCASEGVIFENKALFHFAEKVVETPIVLAHLLGFTLCIFSMYLLMPVLIQHSSAVVLNMSLLMTDVYSALGSILIFNQSVNVFHICSFFVIGAGVLIYNLATPHQDKIEPTDPSQPLVGDGLEKSSSYQAI